MAIDPNREWLGHVQPTGLLVEPIVLTRHGLVPEEQLRADGDALAEHLAAGEDGPALPNPWPCFAAILGWDAAQVAGAPGGPALPDDLAVVLPEADTTLAPTWAVAEPDGGWQLLVRIEAPGIQPDARNQLPGWEATPHQRFERLLRETGIPAGLLITDAAMRLIHAPRGETSGWGDFPLRAMATVGGRPMLGAVKMLLGGFRLFSDARERRLPALLRESREAQAEVSAKLAIQVLGALHELLRGLHAADQVRTERLAATQPHALYEGLLTVLLRLVFLLYAEDRALIPSRADGPARALYDAGYGVRALHTRLLADRARHPDTMDERRGGWGRLLALFRLVHAGDGTGWIRGRGGKLFDPAAFPFLEGRDAADAAPAPAAVTDGCVLRVLDGLLVVAGEKLSYRNLDVEQIGSVYETVMGFSVLTLPGPALAIRAGKNNRTPVFVDLVALAARTARDREKHLKEVADRGQFPAKVAAALAAATGAGDIADALRPIVDERGSPGGTAPAGTPLLQPTDERRRTGSHYTPRSLTEPIVRHALKPAFARLGDDATPEDVLGLRVCDPAMGSGAFLVEACRQLAARLVRAWARHPDARPAIPEDTDEDGFARRLVAQRCLYGVDRNPLAADLARLSLWLATLARDHEFTFLDHALKSGDSLVGLSRAQLGALTWGDDRQGSLFAGFVRDRLKQVTDGRKKIRTAPDDVTRSMQEARHATTEGVLAEVRTLGDAVLACFFAHAKPKARGQALAALRDLGGGPPDPFWAEARRMAATLGHGARPVRPFHWEVEFPEVFSGSAPGLDAVVGNPPFAGKNTLINGHRDHYLDWLQTLHEGAHGNADLVAHFFRRAFALLRPGGCFGLIATNTIGQGDTRESGLRAVIEAGGAILRATRRLKWPGEAAVVVSVVHVLRGAAVSPALDGRQVRRISAYLVEGDLDASPARLAANGGRVFQGFILLGMGFTFDDGAAAKGKASTVAEMHRLIARDPRNAEPIFPYLGGEEVNTSPTQAHDRWCIDFNDFPLRRESMEPCWLEMNAGERAKCRVRGIVPKDYPKPVAEDWPDLLDIVERLVKPERDTQKRDALRERWWQYAEKRPGLRTALATHSGPCPATLRVKEAHSFIWLPRETVYANTLYLFPDLDAAAFAVLHSGVNEAWVRFFSSTLEERLNYAPSDCFDNFPFPPLDAAALHDVTEAYQTHRAALMVARNEGLTKTYNRFHNPSERASDIARLRALHHDLDLAVLRAYGWDDLAETAAPEHLTEATEPDHRYQGRLFWPAPFRDQVLARLLDLNRARAAEERALGLSRGGPDDDDDPE